MNKHSDDNKKDFMNHILTPEEQLNIELNLHTHKLMRETWENMEHPGLLILVVIGAFFLFSFLEKII